MRETDKKLVIRAQRGDREAFRLLVEQYSKQAFRLAFRISGNEEDAEDVVQEAFLRVYKQLKNFEGSSQFSTWLYRVVANCGYDSIRKRRRHTDRAQDLEKTAIDEFESSRLQDQPDRQLEGVEIEKRVSNALQRLSPMEKTAFVLRHFEGMSIEDISRAMNRNASASKHSIFRAVKKLREELQPIMVSAR